MIELHVTVLGEPIGQGAVSGGGQRTSKGGKVYHQPGYHTNRKVLDPWRKAIREATEKAMAEFGLTEPLDEALSLSAVFSMTRGTTVTREEPTVAPDLDHLVRALCDSLTQAGAIKDDARIVEFGRVRKQYETPDLPPGVRFTLAVLESAQQVIPA